VFNKLFNNAFDINKHLQKNKTANIPMNLISIVIPVFNNEKSLNALFEEIKKIEEIIIEKSHKIELLFVDDGSIDNSFQELLEIKSKRQSTRIIKLQKNYGAHQAVIVGLKKAKGEFISILSADLQDDPMLIVKMINEITIECNFVICERNNRDDDIITKIFSKTFYYLLRKFLIKNYPKNGFDIFMINRKLFEKLNLNHNTLYNISLITSGFKFKKILYDRKKRHQGVSQWSLSKKIKLAFDIFINFGSLPVTIISRAGLIISLFSFSYAAFIFINKLFYNIEVKGYAATVILISFFSGIIILMLGFIGEYLIRIYQAVNKSDNIIIEDEI
jgi:dolichol-phosphate mannosyltransferase